MKGRHLATILLATGLLIFTFVPGIQAEEMIVDKANWQKVQGLVPDPVLEWLKKGDWMMKVGDLNFDPGQSIPSWAKESMTENIGKYDLSDELTIIDAKTENVPAFIKGVPFPKINPDDPGAPAKIIYNGNFLRQNNGPLRTMFRLTFMNGKSRTLERVIRVNWWSYAFAGWEAARDTPNPDNLEFYDQVLITEPYDMAGTSLMTWRYLDNKPDMLFGYVPAIRRVRRLTPAGRSDAMFGSDFARDDGGYIGYDGKISDVEWKLLGEAEILGGFNDKDLQPITVNKDGEWEVQGMDNRQKYAAYGYEAYAKDHYKGDVMPWCQTNTVWNKRKVWIIEGRHKNAYYNYGRQIHWVDQENFMVYWKQIFDRADEYWKMFWTTWGMAGTADGKIAGNMIISIVLDERQQHATSIDAYCNGAYYITNAIKNDLNQFSVGGFTKMSK